MLKPLSQKTLEKKYAELGLSKEKTDLLHKYFSCFANLYGVISLRDAWGVFRHYEGLSVVHKREFVAFSDIVRREAGHPYSIYELKEVYRGEETDDPLERMIINNKLILSGYNKFLFVCATVYHQDKPYYLPEKNEFLTFTEDRFYLSPNGVKMKTFIDNLRSIGRKKDYEGKPSGTISDINGASVKGKKLSECVFLTSIEQIEIDHTKREATKQKMAESFFIPASEKILNRIQINLSAGQIFDDLDLSEDISFLLENMDEEYGVSFSEAQFTQFVDLYMSLNNSSHLWRTCGWSPNDLIRNAPRTLPASVSVGKNLKKMFDSGEMNREEFRRELEKIGISLEDDPSGTADRH